MPIFPEAVLLEYITTYVTDDYNLSPDGQWININSVFTQDNKYRMGISIPNNFVHDFKLDQAWPIDRFIQIYQDVSSSEANRILMKIFFKHKKNGLTFSKPRPKIIPAMDLEEIKIKPEMKSLSESGVIRNNTGRKAIRYLIHRNFTAQHILKYQLKYCDQWDCFQCFGSGKDEDDEKCGLCNGSGKNPYYDWLIIPSYENSKLIYYIGRNLDKESDFRYRNPKNLAKSQVVFFYDLLKESDRIFIVEGPMDAMTLFDYSVACIMGNRISDPQVQKILKKNPKQIIFIPDYDETVEKRQIIGKALKKNIESVRKFDSKVEVGVYRWYKKYGEKGKDLNDINHTKIEEDLISMKSFKGEVLDKLENVEQR